MEILEESYYQILDISKDATETEIKSAYFRAKNAYSKDSVATYTLFSETEIHDILRKVEQAYMTLSNPEKRRIYDMNIGQNQPAQETAAFGQIFQQPQSSNQSTQPTSGMAELPGYDEESVFDTGSSEPAETSTPVESPESPVVHLSALSNTSTSVLSRKTKIDERYTKSDSFEEKIEAEEDFKGPMLRRIREYKNISIHEIADMTKVSKSYLYAIEEEDFKKLPASVYVRGFIVQYAKILKLDSVKVTAAYMARLLESREVKEPEKKVQKKGLFSFFRKNP